MPSATGKSSLTQALAYFLAVRPEMVRLGEANELGGSGALVPNELGEVCRSIEIVVERA